MELKINDRVTIPEREWTFVVSRSGGPGGQHVNKVNSRVTLVFDLAKSPRFTAAEKLRIRNALGRRVDEHGIVKLHGQRHRAQYRNREDVLDRFRCLLQRALLPKNRRVPTTATVAARERRLEDKHRRSHVKRRRRATSRFDDE